VGEALRESVEHTKVAASLNTVNCLNTFEQLPVRRDAATIVGLLVAAVASGITYLQPHGAVVVELARSYLAYFRRLRTPPIDVGIVEGSLRGYRTGGHTANPC
jgi:hypothetical protein